MTKYYLISSPKSSNGIGWIYTSNQEEGHQVLLTDDGFIKIGFWVDKASVTEISEDEYNYLKYGFEEDLIKH